ncbi:hypothetical protein M5689_001859 [Euphorbia peplus]|nr:hypothetical protein M5689_001859 [Euphorbia peplus]
MKTLSLLVILLFTINENKMVKAEERMCLKAEPMNPCVEKNCKELCGRKYGGPPGRQGGGANGLCQPTSPGFCTCAYYYKCGK